MSNRRVILVADDEPDIRHLASLRLKEAGHDVIEAIDGEEALRLARERAPDLFLLDVMMPGLNGYEVTEAIRADAALAATPVILLTARVEEEDLASGYASGADDYVRKPFKAADLHEVVERALAGDS